MNYVAVTALGACLLCLRSAAGPLPDAPRRQRRLEPVITPPVLPVLEHLERDPSTLLPHERGAAPRAPPAPSAPRHVFGNSFDVTPSADGLAASFSSGFSSSGGGGGSQAAAQSFSFGFSSGFQASHSASQAASFSSGGFGGASFSGSQASSQSSSFSGGFHGPGGSAASSQSSAFGGASSSPSRAEPAHVNFGEGVLDPRQHRGATSIVFPGEASRGGAHRWRAASRERRPVPSGTSDWLAILVSD